MQSGGLDLNRITEDRKGGPGLPPRDGFNFTLLNEYDAVMPQMLMTTLLGGHKMPDKAMRLIKAAALEAHANRTTAWERQQFAAGK